MDLIELLLGKTRKAIQNAPKRAAEGIITPQEVGASALGPLGERFLGSERQQERAKAGLELGSYAIPLGKGNFFSKFIMPGIASGGVNSLSQDNPSLESVTKSSIAGGAGGALGGAVSNIAGKTFANLTEKLPKNIMDKVFKEGIKQTKSAIGKGTTLGEEALSRGIKGSEESILQKAINAISGLEDNVQGILNSSTQTVDINDLLKNAQPLIDSYKKAGNDSAAKALESRLMSIWQNNGEKIPVQVANDIKRSLYGEVGNAYGAQGSEGIEGLKVLARGIKESIASKVPEMNTLNQELGVQGRIRDAITDKLARTSRNSSMGLKDIAMAGAGGAAAGPAGLMLPFLSKIAGQTQTQTTGANMLNKLGQSVSQSAIPDALSRLLGIGGAKAGQSILEESQKGQYTPNYSSNDNGTQSPLIHTFQSIPQGNQIAKDGDLSPGGEWKFSAQANDWIPNTQNGPQAQETGFTKDKIGQMMLLDLMKTGGKNIPELKALSEFVIPEDKKSKPASAASLQVKGKATAAMSALDQVQQQIQKDPNILLKASIPGAPGARQYEAAVSSITDAIGGLRTGASVSKEQQAFYRNLLPKVGDSAETIQQKMKALRDELGVYLQGSDRIEDPLQAILGVAGQ